MTVKQQVLSIRPNTVLKVLKAPQGNSKYPKIYLVTDKGKVFGVGPTAYGAWLSGWKMIQKNFLKELES